VVTLQFSTAAQTTASTGSRVRCRRQDVRVLRTSV